MHLSRTGRNQGRQLAREQMIAEIGSHDWRDRKVRERPLLLLALLSRRSRQTSRRRLPWQMNSTPWEVGCAELFSI
jgi:hypothetical protein